MKRLGFNFSNPDIFDKHQKQKSEEETNLLKPIRSIHLRPYHTQLLRYSHRLTSHPPICKTHLCLQTRKEEGTQGYRKSTYH